MRTVNHILIILSVLSIQAISAQESTKKEKVVTEYLKSIDISEKEQNEFTGVYKINNGSEMEIKVEINNGVMAIIIPVEEPDEKETTMTEQSSIIPQYKDKFYLKREPFIKVHFTRSKKTNKIISLLYNANKVEGEQVVRANKVK